MTPIDRIAATNRWRDRPLAEKALLAFGLMALALALPVWPTAPLVVAVAGLAVVGGAGVTLGSWLKILAAPLGFALLGAATLLVEIGPGGLALSPDGIAAAAALVLRAAAACAGLLTLALTTPATDVVGGLRRLGVPSDVVEMALLTYRFLLVLGDTAVAMHTAQAARLGDVGTVRRIRSAGRLAANLLPRALDHARRVEIGLAARGWDGGALAVLTPTRRTSPAGLAAVAATLAAVAALGLLARTGAA